MKRIVFLLAFVSLANAQIAIRNATVIDPKSGQVRKNSTIVIEGGRISVVGPAASTTIPKGFRQVDGTNRFVIPGLWDCHVHLTKAGAASLDLFVANGVTSVRDMGSDLEEVLGWRREIEAGSRVGPRIRTSGQILESKKNIDRMKSENGVEPVDRIRMAVANPDEARSAVARLAKAGVDHLKVRTVADAETFDALAAAAKSANLKLTGHAFGPPRNLIGKLGSVEHLLAYPPLDGMTDGERRALFRDMRAADTWMSTSIVNLEDSILVSYSRAKELLADNGKLDPRRRYLGGYLLADWKEQVEEKNDPEQAKMEKTLREQLPNFFRDFRQMREEGVRFLAGTDVAVAFIYPGSSIHKELEIYVRDLGFTAMEALRAATMNPALFFGIQDNQGGIEAGQAADLVLLDKDPLADIRNTRSIGAVVSRGRLFDRRQRQRLLDEAARKTAAAEAAFVRPK